MYDDIPTDLPMAEFTQMYADAGGDTRYTVHIHKLLFNVADGTDRWSQLLSSLSQLHSKQDELTAELTAAQRLTTTYMKKYEKEKLSLDAILPVLTRTLIRAENDASVYYSLSRSSNAALDLLASKRDDIKTVRAWARIEATKYAVSF